MTNYHWFEALVYAWHVPIFFLISGYFLNKNLSFKEFTKKRSKQLLTPYIMTCIGLVLLSPFFTFLYTHKVDISIASMSKWLLAGLFGSGSRPLLHPIYIQPVGAIWFFLALLIAQIVVRFFINYKYGVIGIVAIALIGYLTTPYFWLPFSLQSGMFCALFVYIGYLAKRTQLMDRKVNLFVVLVGVVASIWLYINYKHVGVVENVYGNGVFLDFVIILLIVYLIILFSRFIENKGPKVINKFLLFFGVNSMIVLSVHVMDLNLVNWGPIIGVLSEYIPLTFAKLSTITFRIVLYIILTFLVIKIKQKRIQQK